MESDKGIQTRNQKNIALQEKILRVIGQNPQGVDLQGIAKLINSDNEFSQQSSAGIGKWVDILVKRGSILVTPDTFFENKKLYVLPELPPMKKDEEYPVVTRDGSGRFQKGYVGNPEGRRGNSLIISAKQLQQYAASRLPQAFDELCNIMMDRTIDAGVRTKAISIIFERAAGKPLMLMGGAEEGDDIKVMSYTDLKRIISETKQSIDDLRARNAKDIIIVNKDEK